MPKTKLTKDAVKKASCPSDKRKITYSDTHTPGLVLEVRENGGKTFFYRYHDDSGRQRTIKIGDAKAVALPAARETASQLATQRALGEDPAETRDIARSTPSLGAFFRDQYYPFAQSYKRSVATDERLFRNHIDPAFGHQPMSRITRYDLTRFAQDKRTLFRPSTVNRLLVLIRYMYNNALEWGVPGVVENPASKIKQFLENNQRDRYLTEAEVDRLLDATRNSANTDLTNILAMLLLTGARKGEVLGARWSDIDWRNRQWCIPLPKSGKARHVPLSDSALELLNNLDSRDESAYLFPSPTTGAPYQDIYSSWDRARRIAGLPEVRIHDLRHSFASFLINEGHSLYMVQRLLGHHSITVTERYAHLSSKALEEAAGSAAVGSLLSPVGSAD